MSIEAQSPLPLVAPLPSTCTLYRGDCLEVVPTLAPNGVALCFADLPYGITKAKWDAVGMAGDLWQVLKGRCTPNCAYIFTGTQPFTNALINTNQTLFRYDLVWMRKRLGNFLQANRRPMREHENVLLFYAKQCTYNAQKIPGRVRSDAWKQKASIFHPNGDGKLERGKRSTKHPGTILSVDEQDINNTKVPRLHPTQKPVALLEWLIATYTNAGDTVLDPVMGSGTTGVACARLGRNFIGIEKDAAYFEVASKRIANERRGLGL